jgi:Ca-activated chloride channel homolog
MLIWQRPEWLWALLAVAGFLAWTIWVRRSSFSRTTLLGITLSAIALALAIPALQINESRMAVAILADFSGSSRMSGENAWQQAQRVWQARGRNDAKIIPFGRTPKELPSDALQKPDQFLANAPVDGESTDIEAAVRYALATLPAGKVPKLVLVSDGQETSGNVSRAADQARQLGIPIDVLPVAGISNASLKIDEVWTPQVIYAGERFPIELVLQSAAAETVEVEILAEGKLLGKSSSNVKPGANRLFVEIQLASPGAILVSGKVTGKQGGAARFQHMAQIHKAKFLLISQDPAGSESNLANVLQKNQIELDIKPSLPDFLDGHDVVALNNLDLEAMAIVDKERLEKFATEGGGVLVIGGEKNLYKEGKTQEDALDRVLPAKLAPPKSPEGTLVVLIVDKSSSMEGRKMDLARTAAMGVVENLRPVDYVGVLIFDNSHQWAVPIRKADDRTMIKRLIAGVMPDGGTQIAPALAEAYKRTIPAKGLYKHIVLLTDGISEEGDSLQIAKDALERKITISTVGLGQDVNRTYLEKVASGAKGKSYFLVDPSGLEQILLKDVKEHTGGTAVEKDLKPDVLVKQAAVLDGVGIDKAPPLKGYVRFEPKSAAEVVMKLDEKDPLYSHWQVGLGRAAVFASDAKSRWAQDWVKWDGYGKFWTNVAQDLLPRSLPVETSTVFEAATGNLVTTYRFRPGIDPAPPELFVIGPNEFKKVLPLARIAPGLFRGEANLEGATGSFRVRPLQESRMFPETGFHVDELEYQLRGTNERLLKDIAQYTQGTYRPEPQAVFQDSRRGALKQIDLWPYLLGLAIAVNLGELAWRKLKQ